MTTKTTLQIPGLEIQEEIGRGAYSVVYRVERNQRPFALKVMKDLNEDLAEAALRFRREAGVLARVRHPGLTRVMEVGQIEQRPYLIMQYIEGDTLASLLNNQEPWFESSIIYLAQTIAGALAIVHRHGLVHRDVKPSNILISESGDPKLIDFGFAMQASEEPTPNMVGTFLYSPPEQSGMLRRPVDGRSDLYALGVVLYQCATGHPPFYASDVGELIHQHAVMPLPDIQEHNNEISPALTLIINKLLRKDPDDRYQTGEGLLADLEQIGKLNAALNAGQEIILGTADDRSAALYETPLIGRDTELAQLQAHWHAALKGKGQVVTLIGETGSGKSRLARELMYSAQDKGALTLNGRCVQANPVPFAPIREAIDNLIRHIQRMPQLQKQKEEQQLQTAAGAFTPLLKQFSPLLASTLTETEAIPGLEDAHDLFFEALTHFLRELILSHRAAALLLDDIQWLDDASGQILRHLISELRNIPLLIIATSKTDATFLHQLSTATTTIPFQQINLSPLDETAISQLSTAYLGNYQLDNRIVRQLHSRSQGNPFAVVQYLQAMIDAGLLRPAWGNWVLDTAGLNQLQLPNNVVALMLRRLTESSPQTRSILTAAAVIGVRFSLDLLITICDEPPATVQTATTNAIENYLLETTEGDLYLFIHERVREDLLADVNQTAKQQLHQKIAEALDQNEDSDENIYQLAYHYALGETTKHPERVYATNYAAGQLARHNFAYDDAYDFLQEALNAGEKAGITLTPNLAEAIAAVCFRTGRSQETITFIQKALKVCQQPLQRARLWGRLAEVYLDRRDNVRGWESVEKGFAEIDQSAPKGTPIGLLQTFTSWARWSLFHRQKWAYGQAQDEEQTQLQILTQLYQIATYIAYMGSQPLVLLQLGLRPLYPAHRLGPSRELVIAYSSYAVIQAILQRPQASEKTISQAAQIAHDLDDRIAIGHNMYLHAMAKNISDDALGAEVLAKQCIEQYGRWLNNFHFSVICGDLALNLILRGYFQEAYIWAQRIYERLLLSSNDYQEHIFLPYLGAILIVLGQTAKGNQFLQQARDSLSLDMHDRYRWSLYLGYQVLAYIEQNKLGEELDEAIAAHDMLNMNPSRATYQLRFFFVYQAYARLHQALFQTDPFIGSSASIQLEKAIKLLSAAASTSILQSHLLVIQGAQQYLLGKPETALNQLSKAENAAITHDNPWVLFEVARWRATILQQQKQNNMAQQQARQAYNLALRHKWMNRVRSIRVQFQISDVIPSMNTAATATASKSPSSTTGSTGSLRLQRYLDTLLQVSLASAAILHPDEQAQAALDELVRILGAEHAFLFHFDKETQILSFMAGRDAQRQDLDEETLYSRTVVEQVQHTRQPIILSSTEEGAIIGAESIVAQDIRSIIAAPLLLREELVGIIYLDNRLAHGVFTREDVRILLAVANHIAIALDTASMIEVVHERTQALKAAYNQLERLDRTKSDFISILSHELRTPLTVLDGYCQLLLNDKSLTTNSFHMQLIEGIHKGAERMHEVINSMLDMAKLDSSTLKMAPVSVSLPTLWELIIKKFDNTLQERALTCHIHLPSLQALPPIEADPDLLRKVFGHLLTNAIKYTPDGGRITISGQEVPPGQYDLAEGGIEVVVSDTGIGIDPEYHDLIFIKFYQTGQVALHSSGKTKFKGGGPGLGLTIAKGIVETHGGQMWVESPGHDEETFPGSNFHIVLPLKQKTPDSSPVALL